MAFLLAILGQVRVAPAQAGAEIRNNNSIVQTHNMVVTYYKTTSIIFPTPIKSVDRGSLDIIARKASEVNNVLQLKANRENFPETNLTVITADGILHQFTINYEQEPEALSLDLSATATRDSDIPQPFIQFQQGMTESDLQDCARQIVNADKVTLIKHQRQYKIGIFLKGIYIKDGVMFFHFTMNNTSNIKYDVEFLRFYLQDRERVKRTASQEIALTPVFVYGNDQVIPANGKQEVVYAFNKFTIPDAKKVMVEIFEQNGGRSLAMGITNRNIVNARLIP